MLCEFFMIKNINKMFDIVYCFKKLQLLHYESKQTLLSNYENIGKIMDES